MGVYQLIYRSVATRLPGVEELARMIEQARINNYSQGVTGVLFYASGRFLQVLEGEAKQVKALYERICQDSRHTDVVKLHGAPVSQPLFPEWSMGFGQVGAPALARLNARLTPKHRAAPLPRAYASEAFMSAVIHAFVREELAAVEHPRRALG
jgi:Sensors of blue-light using FAD